MTLESSKALGGVGALLIVIGLAAYVNTFVGILSLVGAILVLIALKGLADNYNEAGIFNNALYAVIIAIVGGIVSIATIVVTALSALASLDIPFNLTDPNAIRSMIENAITALMDMGTFWTFVGAIVAAVVALFVFAIVAVVFFRRSLNMLAARTGVGMFATAGLLMLIGAILTIIVIGLLLIWIAWILVAVAFFSIRIQPTPPPATTPPQQTA